MAENIQVAALSADVKVTIPKKELGDFQAKLATIADTLEFITEQMLDMTKHVKGAFKDTNRHLKVTHNQNTKIVNDYRQMNKQARKHERTAKRTAKAMGGIEDAIAQIRVEQGLLNFAMNNMVKLMAIPAAIIGGFTFLAAKITGMTTEMALLSKATGFSLNHMRALEVEAKRMGFTFEHVNSLIEEMNNKLGGEAGGFVEINLQEGLDVLKVSSEELQKLKPEEQIEKIMNASQDLMRKGELAKVASAFDKMFGQEGNRLLGGFAQKMADTGKTYREIIEQNKRFVSLTDDAQKGARLFTGFFQTAGISIRTVMEEFFGQIGVKLSPFFQGVEPMFEDLAAKVMKWLGPGTLDAIADTAVMAFKELVIVFDEIDKAGIDFPDLVRDMANAMQGAWRTGRDLVAMFVKFGIIILPLANLLNNDLVRGIVSVTTAVLAGVVAWSAFGKVLSWIKLPILALATKIPILNTALMATGVASKAVGAVFTKWVLPVAAVAALSYWIGKLVTEFLGLDKILANVVDKMDIFGRGKHEANIRLMDERNKVIQSKIQANNARRAMLQGNPAQTVNKNSSVSSNTTTHITQHNDIKTTETQKELLDSYQPSSPY